jgi:hypothetical protein
VAYADDVNLIGRTIRDLKEAFIKLEHEAQKMGLRINDRKTKYMEVSAQPSTIIALQIGEYDIKKVAEFKYLGSMVNTNNDLSLEVQHRLKAADKCYFGLRKHFRSHYINIRTKCRLYKTLI